MTGAPSKRLSPDDMSLIDADIHVGDTPAALAPYCEQPWRETLEMLANKPHGYLDINGYAAGLRSNPPVPGGQPRKNVPDAKNMRASLDMLGIGAGLLVPDYLLLLAGMPNVSYARALGRAFNRWVVDQWTDPAKGLYAAIIAAPQDPDDAAREIERYADHPGVKAIYLPTAGVSPLWGDRIYEPVMAAAESSGMPLLFHSVSAAASAFPANMEQFENQYGRQVIAHPFSMMSNLVSLMHTGVPARHPDLKIVFTEAGISWAPFLMWRLDKYHQEFRRQVPFLEERPSDYMKRQMWFATQPIEEPDDPAHLVDVIHHCGGADRIIFASDWPHHDFDHPRALNKLPLTDDERHKIMWKNAADVFNISMPPTIRQIREATQSAHKSMDELVNEIPLQS